MGDFSQAFSASNAFGRLAGVTLPEGRDPVPSPVLERLLPQERAHALSLTGRRQIEWVGGRLAFRLAVNALDPVGLIGAPITGLVRLNPVASIDRAGTGVPVRSDHGDPGRSCAPGLNR